MRCEVCGKKMELRRVVSNRHTGEDLELYVCNHCGTHIMWKYTNKHIEKIFYHGVLKMQYRMIIPYSRIDIFFRGKRGGMHGGKGSKLRGNKRGTVK